MITNTKIARSLLLVTLLLMVITGGPGFAAPQEPPGVQPVESEAGGFSVATFNTGLARGALPFASERRALIAEALNGLDTDVLCLQEVWTDEDAEALISAVKSVYPYSYRMKIESKPPKEAKCGLFKALKLNRCVKSKCISQGVSVFECVRGACEEAYEALGDECQRCLAANSNRAWRCTSDLFRAHEYVYGGRNGLLLLSRYPIERPEYTAFDTVLIKRGAIGATIAGRSIFCTHLTAALEAIPYPEGRSHRSFKEEQAGQFGWLASAAPADSCAVVLGDFNSGPSSETLTSEHPEHYASILAEGFVEPWSDRFCTYCQDNPLAGWHDDLQLDHILFRGCGEGKTARYSRILDHAVEFKAGGKARKTRLSDHYGLRLVWETQPD